MLESLLDTLRGVRDQLEEKFPDLPHEAITRLDFAITLIRDYAGQLEEEEASETLAEENRLRREHRSL